MTDPDLAQFRDKFQQDFRDEALRLALCRHPHIVQIDNAFQEGSLPCIAMEYVQGENLWQRVTKLGALSEAEALCYIRQIGSALTLIHDKGLLHRDVKPQNIMVRPCRDLTCNVSTEAVLIDFGIAREFIPDVIQTHTQAISNGFAPIEQYAKRAKRGEYTDVYALAATLYYLLTKKVPHPAFVRAARVDLEPVQQLNPTISDRVNQAILKGMAFEPEDRPQSVAEWLELLKFDGFDDVAQIGNSPSVDLHEPPQATTLSPETPVEAVLLTLKYPHRRILWVDDYPANIAYEVSKLRDNGVEVIQALTTAEAMEILSSDNLPFNAVISDIKRREDGEYQVKAALWLLKAIQEAHINLPIFIYTAGRPITRSKQELLAAGATAVTNSAVELFKLLKEYMTLLPSTADAGIWATLPIPAADDLSSAVAVDYSNLRDLLAAGKWQNADEETGALMLKVAEREEDGWLESEHIENFPGQDLRTINRLWVGYSNGRFGFSVQKRIYEDCGQDYITFGNRVGWRVEGNWLWWNNLTFTIDAPLGHLPSWRVGGSGGVWGCFVTGGGFVLSRPDL